MKNTNEKLLKEINIDILFFFLAAIKAGVSFYLINEKKKSALNIESINNTTANKIYYYKNGNLTIPDDLNNTKEERIKGLHTIPIKTPLQKKKKSRKDY